MFIPENDIPAILELLEMHKELAAAEYVLPGSLLAVKSDLRQD